MAPILAWAILVGTFGALPASAAAQVFVDPGSPASRDNGIPLQEARRESAPEGDRNDRRPPLFGEGVAPGRPSPPARASATELDAGSPSRTWTIGVPLLVLAGGGALGLGVRRLVGRRYAR